MTERREPGTEWPAAGPVRASASDYLAIERTFLAWLRTAVALIGLGISINRFSLYLAQIGAGAAAPEGPARRLLYDSERLGVGMVILGMIGLVFAAWRYRHVTALLDRGVFQPSPYLAWATTIVVLLFGGVALVSLFQR